MDGIREIYDELIRDVSACSTFESLVCGKKPKPYKLKAKYGHNVAFDDAPKVPFDTYQRVSDVVKECKRARKRAADDSNVCVTDQQLFSQTRFTDDAALAPFAPFLHYVPRLVNVVTLAEATPMVGSGLSLPLDLFKIASVCNGAYFASKRFAAVQLAFTHPRCRVLIFHTGRLVGTGCQGPIAARLAIARAQRQLADEANVHLNIRNFSVINQVGAVSLNATLNCDSFAENHKSESHFDRASFVGLAWRPKGESCCVEIYSTGRANLPGAGPTWATAQVNKGGAPPRPNPKPPKPGGAPPRPTPTFETTFLTYFPVCLRRITNRTGTQYIIQSNVTRCGAPPRPGRGSAPPNTQTPTDLGGAQVPKSPC